MSAADWQVEYDDDGAPTSMRWNPKGDRASRRCPRTFPHDPHGPWFDGRVWRPGDGPGGYDCPGVPLADLSEASR